MFLNIPKIFTINKSSVNIPNFLKNRKISDQDVTYLKHFFNYFNITYFSEITIDMLSQFAKNDYEKAIQVNTLLGLYGVEFVGKSAKKYSPNSRNIVKLIKINTLDLKIYEIKLFNINYQNIELKILQYFEKIGLTNSNHIAGINISTLLDKISLYDIDINDLIKNIDLNYINICDENNFYDCKTTENSSYNQVSVSNMSIKNTALSTRTINCLLANSIDTMSKLAELDLGEFRHRKNVGAKTVDEIVAFLKNSFDSAIDGYTVTDKNTENISLNNNTIIEMNEKPLDENVWNISIDELDISTKTKEQLCEHHIKTIGDFLLGIKNNKIDYYQVASIYKVLEIFGIKRNINYFPKTLHMPEAYFLLIGQIFTDDWIIQACKKHKLKNIGLLAGNFPDIFSQDDSLCSQDVFFEKISIIENKLKELQIYEYPVELSYSQKVELNKKTIDEITKENYIKKIINKVQEIFLSQNTNKELEQKQLKFQLKEKEVDVLFKRYGINENKNKMTLEEIGQLYGCTRERIRQLEANGIKKITNLLFKEFKSMNLEIKQLFDYYGHIVSFPVLDNDEWCDLIIELLSKNKECCFKIDFKHSIMIRKNFNIEELNNELIKILKNFGEYINYTDIEEQFKNVLQKYLNLDNELKNKNFLKVYNILLNKFIDNNVIYIHSQLYKLSSKKGRKDKQERNEKIIYLIEKLYPQGIHLPIDNDNELQENLKLLYDNYPEIADLNVRSLSDRLIKQDKDIIWWGRGLYIHINNTNANLEVVDFAIEEIIKKFNSGIHRLKPYAIFAEYQEKFLVANIPNEIALLGLIKYKNHPRIDTQRQEIRDIQNFNADLNILDSFEEYIKKYPNGIEKRELFLEMCNKRGWKPYQIDFLLSRSNVVFKDNNLFMHYDNININKNKMSDLIEKITEEINSDNISVLHLRKIQNKYPATWVGITNKNISPSFMGRLLCRELKNNNFIIDNFVYVKKAEHTIENISLLKILDKFVAEKSLENKYVTIAEITEFCRKQGLKDTKQPIIDCVTKFSFEYNDEAYVHNNILGYTEEFKEDIFELAQKISEIDLETPLIKYEDLISEYNNFLPILNEGYEWNIYLLRSALKYDENIDTFDKAFIFKDNKFGVEDLDDTAAYLMMKNCENGYCKFKELDKLLARFGVTPYKNLHFYKSRLFFEGSSIKSVDNNTAVSVEKFARDKYSNV